MAYFEWSAKEAAMTDRATIKIPRPLDEKLRHVIEEPGHRSATQSVVHALRDLAAERPSEPSALSARGDDIGRQRLRNLSDLE
jgi:hypothetical protein